MPSTTSPSVTIKRNGFIGILALSSGSSPRDSAGAATAVPGAGSELNSEDALASGADSFGLDEAVSLVVAPRGAALDADAAASAMVFDDVASCSGADTSGIDDVVSSVVAPPTDASFGLIAITSRGGEGGLASPGRTVDGAPSAVGFGLAGAGTEYKGEARSFVADGAACLTDWSSVRTYQHLR